LADRFPSRQQNGSEACSKTEHLAGNCPYVDSFVMGFREMSLAQLKLIKALRSKQLVPIESIFLFGTVIA
jgi:hypothetical protein